MPLSDSSWKLLLSVAGTAGVCALVYYLATDGVDDAKLDEMISMNEEKEARRASALSYSKEQVRQLLDELNESRVAIKAQMSALSTAMIERPLSIQETYKHLKDTLPVDPLERHALTPEDLPVLFETFKDDAEIRDALHRMMDNPPPTSGKPISVEKVIRVHRYMVEEFDTVAKTFLGLRDRKTYDPKIVTLAAQAILASKVEAKFGLSSEEIDAAVMQNYKGLGEHPEFNSLNEGLRHTLIKLTSP